MEGIEIAQSLGLPELSVTADGGTGTRGADIETSRHAPRRPQASIAEAKRLVTERSLTLRQEDGTLPLIYNRAV